MVAACDINAPDFSERFSRESAVVGVIGMGSTGQAVRGYFARHGFRTVAYDKFRPEHGTLEDVVRQAHLVFVCVPSPVQADGHRFDGIVQGVLDDVAHVATASGRPDDTFVVCIKSSLSPGSTDRMRSSHPAMRIVFGPEIPRDTSPARPSPSRVAVAGDPDDRWVVLRFFLEADRRGVEAGEIRLVELSHPATLEAAVSMADGLLDALAASCEEHERLCAERSLSYRTVRSVAMRDPRILSWCEAEQTGGSQ